MLKMFIKKHDEASEFEAGDLTILRELVHPVNDGLAIGYSLAHARLPLGAASLPHSLKGSELYYILQGKGQLFINSENRELTKGDSALVPPMSIQYIKNIGEEELLFLCIVEPFWRLEDEELP
jgi:mannose-6-phosphate isomerase-like protein (cupin superfamily)